MLHAYKSGFLIRMIYAFSHRCVSENYLRNEKVLKRDKIYVFIPFKNVYSYYL